MYFFAPKTELNGDANATIQSANSIINDMLKSAQDSAQGSDTNAPNFEATSAPKVSDSNEIKAPISTDSTKIISKITSDKMELQIDELGRIYKVLLKEKKYLNDDGTPLNLFDDKSIKPLELRFQNKEVNAKAFSTPYIADIAEVSLDKSAESGKDSSDSSDSSKDSNPKDSAKQITLTQNLGEITGLGAITIKKILTFYDDFSYDIKVELNKPLNYYVANGSRPVADSSAYVFKGVIVKKSDETLEKIE